MKPAPTGANEGEGTVQSCRVFRWRAGLKPAPTGANEGEGTVQSCRVFRWRAGLKPAPTGGATMAMLICLGAQNATDAGDGTAGGEGGFPG